MTMDPILLVGGSGIVGRWTARLLRAAHPDAPLLIGGRDLPKAQKAAAEIGGAEGVAIDMAAADLGLGERAIGAVAVLFTDERVAGLRFAQDREVPYINISPGINELAPEVAAYIHRPGAAAVVLGTEWLAGATSIPTLEFAKAFGRVESIAIGALLDEEDAYGPAAAADLERQTKT
ncbi:NAD(P)-dependent oxidoreductase, partial [bacterium]